MLKSDIVIKFLAVAVTLSSVALSNCATQRYEYGPDAVREYQLSEAEVMQLQFYLTDPIHLHKLDAVQYKNSIEFHVLKQERSSEVHEIVLKRGTPGVPVGSGPNWIDIDFGNDLVIRFVNFLGGNKIQLINGANIFESPQIEYRNDVYLVQFEEHESHQDKGQFRRIPEIEFKIANEQRAFFHSNRQVLKGKKLP